MYFVVIFFRDGVPYCEQDYQAEFGVTCAGCDGYITGKVLQVSYQLINKTMNQQLYCMILQCFDIKFTFIKFKGW